MEPFDQLKLAMTRRHFFSLNSTGLGAVALVTVLLSLGPLAGSELLEFFAPAEIALLWLEHVAELSLLAAALTVAVNRTAWPKTSPLTGAALTAVVPMMSRIPRIAMTSAVTRAMTPSALFVNHLANRPMPSSAVKWWTAILPPPSAVDCRPVVGYH